MGIDVKGASQLKSIACLKKSGTHAGDRHVRHFQVASLEIERTRRLKERQDALNRIHATEARIAEIDALLLGHYDVLGLSPISEENEGGTPHASPISSERRTGHSKADPGPQSRDGEPRRMLVYGR